MHLWKPRTSAVAIASPISAPVRAYSHGCTIAATCMELGTPTLNFIAFATLMGGSGAAATAAPSCSLVGIDRLGHLDDLQVLQHRQHVGDRIDMVDLVAAETQPGKPQHV